MKKRLISILLALIMLLGMLPMGVMAADAAESAQTEPRVITLDFKSLGAELSEQDWWSDLVMGSKGAANMAEAEAAQYDALRSYLSANKGWTIIEEWSQFKNMYQAKELVINTDTTKDWGLRYYAGYVGVETHDKMYLELTVSAEDAGWYTFSADVFKESVYSAQASHNFQGGGGYGLVQVNGEEALAETSFLGQDTVETLTGNVIKLVEGTNLIAICNTKDVNGQASNAIRSLCFNSITFTEAENPCTHENTTQATAAAENKTHEITVTCTDCGDTVSTETVDCTDENSDKLCDVCGNDLRDTIVIDFKALAAELSAQDWWNDLVMGSKGAADMAEAEAAQYDALLAYLSENKNWTISEEWSQFKSMYQAKEMVINTDATKDWGLRYYAGYVGVETHDKMYLELTVSAEEAGWYEFNTEIFRESVYSTQASHGFQGGGGYGVIIVNGEEALAETAFVGQDTAETLTGNVIKLVEGTNLIAIANTKDVNGQASNAIRSLCLNNITFYKTAELCKHENITVDYADNGDKTHTVTVTCDCGEVVSTETADCADDDKDTLCDDCGAAIVELTAVNVGGSNMTLGNDLKMNFMVKTAELQDGLTMRVTQDGKEPVVLTPEKYNSTYHYVAYSVAAKEMTDVLTVEVLNADGYVISEPYTRTIAYYATNLLTKSTSTDKLKSVAVDMLNYGTEAQKYFSYNEDDYANANISAEDQTAYATTGATCDVQRVLGTNAAGTNLSLEASILLNVFFNSTTTDGMTATVTYTNYKGAEVTAEAAVEKYSSSRVKVVVDEIVLADTKRPVTATVYKDGVEYGTCTEAVGGYATRKLEDETMGSICQAILNFATSAYTYLGGTH